MSRCSIEKITCPKCNKESDFIIWSSVNTMLDPDMKEKVRNKEAFKFCCPDCGATTNVDYGFLYHQMEDNMMIYYVTSQEDVEKVHEMFRGDDKVTELLGAVQEKYLYRIVTSVNELREKLFIFDAGLDDRTIELIKLFYAGKLEDDNPQLEYDEIRAEVDETGNIVLFFIGEKGVIASCEVGTEFYGIVTKEFIEKRPVIREDDIQINFKWALGCIRETKQ